MRAISVLVKMGCVILVCVLTTAAVSFTGQKQNITRGSDSAARADNASAPNNTTTPEVPDTEANDTAQLKNPPAEDNAAQPTQQSNVSGTGTIKFLYFEGGFYGIISDDGKHYDPMSLDGEFQVNGLRVKFEAELLKGVATIRMWGTPVSIIRIEKINP